MDRPTTPRKLTRPKPSRTPSQTDTTSAPQRSQTALRQALPTLHLPGRHHHNHAEKSKRHGEKQSLTHAAVHSPANVPSALADKLVSSRSDSKSQTPQDSVVGREKGTSAPVQVPARPIRAIDVAKERHRRMRREEELKSNLDQLSDLASSSTRKVDMLFMSLKEKLGTLRSTLQKLQQLSDESQRMRQEFDQEAKEIEDEYEDQVDHFKGFETQQNRVESLHERIEDSMNRSEQLQERLKKCRGQVADWEKREDEWQARTSFKLRIGWACFGTLVGLILLGIVVHVVFFRTASSTAGVSTPLNTSDMGALWRELHIARPKGRPTHDTGRSSTTALAVDPRIRMLDEL